MKKLTLINLIKETLKESLSKQGEEYNYDGDNVIDIEINEIKKAIQNIKDNEPNNKHFLELLNNIKEATNILEIYWKQI